MLILEKRRSLPERRFLMQNSQKIHGTWMEGIGLYAVFRRQNPLN